MIPGLSTLKTWLIGLTGIALAIVYALLKIEKAKALEQQVKEVHKARKANAAADKAIKKQRKENRKRNEEIIHDIETGDDSYLTGVQRDKD